MRWKTSSSWSASTSPRMRPRPRRPSSDPVARKLAEWIILRSDDNGASVERYRAFIIGQSELAVADLPAPAPRGGAVGRPSRRCHGVGMVRKRIAAVGQGQVRAGAGDARARRPRQCGASGARRLAQRFHVRGHREHGARPVRRAADAGRSQGADGSVALRQRARGRAARRQAAGRRPGRAGEGAHRGLSQGLQHQGAAGRGAARTAWRSRLHLQQDPAAPPRGEIRRGRPAHARRAEGSRPPLQSRRMVDRAAACCRARCSTSASTAPPI